MSNIEELIRAEIERRIETYKKGYANGDDRRADALELLLSFLDTLEEPKKDFPTTDNEVSEFLATHNPVEVPDKYKTPAWLFKEEPVCEELEEELATYLQRYYNYKYPEQYKDGSGSEKMPHIIEAARHFAEWQSKQDKETIELAEDHAYLAGAVNEREKMMKESVEWTVTTNLANRPVIYLDQLKGFQYGDKVRIIIVKED